MRKVSLQEVLDGAKGRVIYPQEPGSRHFFGIATDTRKSMKGELFWALKGETHDAHRFLRQALQQGASGLVVQVGQVSQKDLQFLKSEDPSLAIVEVHDSLQALQDFAHFVRKRSRYKLIGITGSNGKTSTKEFSRALLEKQLAVHANKGSFNNQFGLPFNLLEAPESTQILIAEMGMNHSGEITELVKIADPDVVLCTMVGTAHIENLGSQEAIAAAKNEIYLAARPDAFRIYNLDNAFCMKMFKEAIWKCHLNEWALNIGVFFEAPSSDGGSSVEPSKVQSKFLVILDSQWKNLEQTYQVNFSEKFKSQVKERLLQNLVSMRVVKTSLESLQVSGVVSSQVFTAEVPVFGKQNLTNLMAASSAALAVGASSENLISNLPQCRSAWGRNQILKSRTGAVIVFDAYNANPESVEALLVNIQEADGFNRKFAVLANMAELGKIAAEAHQKVGSIAAATGFEALWFYGENHADFLKGAESSFAERGKKTPLETAAQLDRDRLSNWAERILASLRPGDILVMKGSRSQKMERLLELLV